jgi:four helix bundle protein
MNRESSVAWRCDMPNRQRPGAFEDLIAWQKSRKLFVAIHRKSEVGRLKNDFSFKSQFRRAAHSIPTNIAEGFGRYSDKEFLRFLSIANGSAYEVRSHIILAQDVEYLTPEAAGILNDKCQEVSRLIEGLRKSLKRNL